MSKNIFIVSDLNGLVDENNIPSGILERRKEDYLKEEKEQKYEVNNNNMKTVNEPSDIQFIIKSEDNIFNKDEKSQENYIGNENSMENNEETPSFQNLQNNNFVDNESSYIENLANINTNNNNNHIEKKKIDEDKKMKKRGNKIFKFIKDGKNIFTPRSYIKSYFKLYLEKAIQRADNHRKNYKTAFFTAVKKWIDKIFKIKCKFDHNFITNNSKVVNGKMLEETLEDIIKKYNNKKHIILDKKNDTKYNYIFKKTMKELFNEFLNSEEFEKSNKKIKDREKLNDYIIVAEDFINYYSI